MDMVCFLNIAWTKSEREKDWRSRNAGDVNASPEWGMRTMHSRSDTCMGSRVFEGMHTHESVRRKHRCWAYKQMCIENEERCSLGVAQAGAHAKHSYKQGRTLMLSSSDRCTLSNAGGTSAGVSSGCCDTKLSPRANRVRHSVAIFGQRLMVCDQSMREKAWRSRKRGA